MVNIRDQWWSMVDDFLAGFSLGKLQHPGWFHHHQGEATKCSQLCKGRCLRPESLVIKVGLNFGWLVITINQGFIEQSLTRLLSDPVMRLGGMVDH